MKSLLAYGRLGKGNRDPRTPQWFYVDFKAPQEREDRAPTHLRASDQLKRI